MSFLSVLIFLKMKRASKSGKTGVNRGSLGDSTGPGSR